MPGQDPSKDVILRIAVPYPLLLRVLRELDPSDPRQRQISDELIEALPMIIAARVEVIRELQEELERELYRHN